MVALWPLVQGSEADSLYMKLVVPLSLVVSTIDIGLHHRHSIMKLRTRYTVEASEFIRGFLFVDDELATCQFSLKPLTASSDLEDQLSGWMPLVLLVPPPLLGCSRFAHCPQHPPTPRTHSPWGNTHLSGFLPHLLFGTKYTPLKVFLKNVLQQKQCMCLECKWRK